LCVLVSELLPLCSSALRFLYTSLYTQSLVSLHQSRVSMRESLDAVSMCESLGAVSMRESLGAVSMCESLGAVSMRESLGAVSSLYKRVSIANLYRRVSLRSLYSLYASLYTHMRCMYMTTHTCMYMSTPSLRCASPMQVTDIYIQIVISACKLHTKR